MYLADGMSPSGKAAGSGPAIRGFESLHPSQDLRNKNEGIRTPSFYFRYCLFCFFKIGFECLFDFFGIFLDHDCTNNAEH